MALCGEDGIGVHLEENLLLFAFGELVHAAEEEVFGFGGVVLAVVGGAVEEVVGQIVGGH